MKLITKHTDYAIRALMHLAGREGAIVPASEISKSDNIPEKFLKRLLSTLKKNKYIITKEGKGGGVTLAKEPESILVSDIMRTFQGEFQISDCMFKKAMCPNRKTCVLRVNVRAIEKNLEKQFGKISIGSLLRQNKRKRGTEL